MFLKNCKCIEKNVSRQITDAFESSSDDSNDSNNSDEESIKDMKLMFLDKTISKNVFFEGAILKMYSGCLTSK